MDMISVVVGIVSLAIFIYLVSKEARDAECHGFALVIELLGSGIIINTLIWVLTRS